MSEPVWLDEGGVAALALAMLDLHIAPECLPGVRANLDALAAHTRRVESEPPSEGRG